MKTMTKNTKKQNRFHPFFLFILLKEGKTESRMRENDGRKRGKRERQRKERKRNIKKKEMNK